MTRPRFLFPGLAAALLLGTMALAHGAQARERHGHENASAAQPGTSTDDTAPEPDVMPPDNADQTPGEKRRGHPSHNRPAEGEHTDEGHALNNRAMRNTEHAEENAEEAVPQHETLSTRRERAAKNGKGKKDKKD
jgi:hypothetical protein